ncbi:unnamed protein product [Urochloa humidicola]
MPRRYGSAAVKEAVNGGASSEAVPGRAKLDTLLEKVKAPRVSSKGILQAIDVINQYRWGLKLQKTTQTWVLALAVAAGCAFGSGWTPAPTRKHLVKEEMAQ